MNKNDSGTLSASLISTASLIVRTICEIKIMKPATHICDNCSTVIHHILTKIYVNVKLFIKSS